ncbi:MAG: helix-turn-helix domain-containing protein [Geitlerinemataceae cyanobacterium]
MALPPSSAPTLVPIGLDDRELRVLASQITRDLLQSPTYRDVLDILAATPADRDPEAVHRAVQTTARHAVRTTLKYFRLRPATMPTTRPRPPLPLPPRPQMQRPTTAHPATDRTPPPIRSARPARSNVSPRTKSARYNASSSYGDSHTSPDRQTAYLLTLGRRLRARRQSCRFSLAQLHHLTKIPLQHLQAFESGQLDALPSNPSYLWGTVRIWGNVLGLDGLALATGIPDSPATELPLTSAPPTSAHPALARPTTASAPQGSQLPRYLTYGTIAAGTLLGISWLAESTGPPAPEPPPSEPSALTTIGDRQRQQEVQRAILPSDVAPPEGIRRHLRRN